MTDITSKQFDVFPTKLPDSSGILLSSQVFLKSPCLAMTAPHGSVMATMALPLPNWETSAWKVGQWSAIHTERCTVGDAPKLAKLVYTMWCRTPPVMFVICLSPVTSLIYLLPQVLVIRVVNQLSWGHHLVTYVNCGLSLVYIYVNYCLLLVYIYVNYGCFMDVYGCLWQILPSGKLTWLLKMAHVQLIYPLKMVIFHSYVSYSMGL